MKGDNNTPYFDCKYHWEMRFPEIQSVLIPKHFHISTKSMPSDVGLISLLLCQLLFHRREFHTVVNCMYTPINLIRHGGHNGPRKIETVVAFYVYTLNYVIFPKIYLAF